MEADFQIYKNGKLTFILTPEKLLVITHLQSFFLQPVEYYSKNRLRIIRRLIEQGEVNDLNSLAIHCGKEIRWVNTFQTFMIDKITART